MASGATCRLDLGVPSRSRDSSQAFRYLMKTQGWSRGALRYYSLRNRLLSVEVPFAGELSGKVPLAGSWQNFTQLQGAAPKQLLLKIRATTRRPAETQPDDSHHDTFITFDCGALSSLLQRQDCVRRDRLHRLRRAVLTDS